MRSLALTMLLAGSAALQADILHLRDGSRHYGEVVSQNDREVVFRVELPDGSGSVVRTFAADLVARVERTTWHPPVTRPPEVLLPDEAQPDYEQILREGFELLDDGDVLSALRALQYAVLQAPQPVLDELDEQCRTARGTPLDELLARTRMAVAGRADRGRTFRLTFATRYELDALGRLLAQAQDSRLSRRYDGHTVEEWAADSSAYTEVRPDSRGLVADAGRAAAVISVRLRLDPQLKDVRGERARLVRLREQLARLSSHVLALRGYTAPAADDGASDPAEQTADRLAAEARAASQPVRESEEPGGAPPRPAEASDSKALPAPSSPSKMGTGSELDPPADGQQSFRRGACPRFQQKDNPPRTHDE